MSSSPSPKTIRFEDIKQGDYVGATTMPGPNGTQVAVEVHYLAPTTTEGQLAGSPARVADDQRDLWRRWSAVRAIAS